MNTTNAMGIILSSARKHPWLIILLIIAIIAHAADLQWPDLHKFLSSIAYGFFSVALLYASGTSLADKPQNPPEDPAAKPPTDK